MRQLERLHVTDKVGLVGIAAKTRVTAAFFVDTAAGAAVVVVGRIHRAAVGQAEQLLDHRMVERMRVALLKVAAPAAANQQRVAGEHHRLITQHIAHAAVGVAGRGAGFQLDAVDAEALAGLQRQVDVLGVDHRRRGNLAAGFLLQQPGGGDVVGVGVGVDHQFQRQAQLLQQRQVAGALLEHRVDQQGLAAGRVRQQVGIGRGSSIEQLTKEHGHLAAVQLRSIQYIKK